MLLRDSLYFVVSVSGMEMETVPFALHYNYTSVLICYIRIFLFLFLSLILCFYLDNIAYQRSYLFGLMVRLAILSSEDIFRWMQSLPIEQNSPIWSRRLQYYSHFLVTQLCHLGIYSKADVSKLQVACPAITTSKFFVSIHCGNTILLVSTNTRVIYIIISTHSSEDSFGHLFSHIARLVNGSVSSLNTVFNFFP